MKSLAKLLSLPAEDRRLLGRALATNVEARLALHVLSIDRLRAWATRPGTATRDVERIVWAGRAAARRTPFATCLSSALALQRLLAAHGHDSELHIGVAGDDGVFAAHAWLEREGRILIGEDDRARYTRLTGWTTTPAASREQA
ncbi:MAG: lasso peptide biosynthesis B2 protein [Proteobacteria bacterium]|nr:lasso peptide biosynthesis B2 protein [Pseudomonadota bacterium]